ncbi:MAG: hypothetical protein ACK55Z_00930, partial [bacterium]
MIQPVFQSSQPTTATAEWRPPARHASPRSPRVTVWGRSKSGRSRNRNPSSQHRPMDNRKIATLPAKLNAIQPGKEHRENQSKIAWAAVDIGTRR